jgi:hypothetical protein
MFLLGTLEPCLGMKVSKQSQTGKDLAREEFQNLVNKSNQECMVGEC